MHATGLRPRVRRRSASVHGCVAAGLVAGGALGVVWVAVGAEVGGVVAAWAVGSESVDVVDVGGELGAVGFAAQWVRVEVAVSGASPLGVVAAGVGAAALLFGRSGVVVAASAVGELWTSCD